MRRDVILPSNVCVPGWPLHTGGDRKREPPAVINFSTPVSASPHHIRSANCDRRGPPLQVLAIGQVCPIQPSSPYLLPTSNPTAVQASTPTSSSRSHRSPPTPTSARRRSRPQCRSSMRRSPAVPSLARSGCARSSRTTTSHPTSHTFCTNSHTSSYDSPPNPLPLY